MFYIINCYRKILPILPIAKWSGTPNIFILITFFPYFHIIMVLFVEIIIAI